jgi:hypothetical protein
MALDLSVQVRPVYLLFSQSNHHGSLPAGIFAWFLIFFVLPDHFPHGFSVPTEIPVSIRIWRTTKSCFRELDLVGAFIILTACSFAIAALQEGNSQYTWSSSLVISFLVISGVFWFIFVGWEWFISRYCLRISPIFPWRLTHNRVFMGVALCVVLLRTRVPYNKSDELMRLCLADSSQPDYL